MESWWNEYIYIAIWVIIILSILLGVSLGGKQEDSFINAPGTEIDLQAFFQPYRLKDVCTLYGPVYDSIVISFKPLEGQEAREAANKEVKKHIPGGPLNCALTLPSSKEPQDIFNFLSGLSDTFLADIYATLLFTVSTLQSTLDQNDIAGAVALIAKEGKILHHKSYGFANLASQETMKKDAIFRIASQTKGRSCAIANSRCSRTSKYANDRKSEIDAVIACARKERCARSGPDRKTTNRAQDAG